jgi:hypothetical protein
MKDMLKYKNLAEEQNGEAKISFPINLRNGRETLNNGHGRDNQ